MRSSARIAVATALLLLVGACSSEPEPVATVDGVELDEARLTELHAEPAALDDDERVGSVLLLVLRQAFTSRAETDLGVAATTDEIDAAEAELLAPIDGRGDRAEVLAARNETEARIRVNAELDALRDRMEAHLVRTESGGFDLDEAQRAFLLANAEVCVHHIQLDDPGAVDEVLERLAGGEPFEAVARELSVDPFVARAEGTGAGGDLGCSAPSALPAGLDEAVLSQPVGRPTGPVTSAVGVHVLLVDERSTPDLDARHDEVVEAAIPTQGPELFRRWAVDVLQTIDVSVDPAYGRWGMLPETDPVPTVVSPARIGDIIGE